MLIVFFSDQVSLRPDSIMRNRTLYRYLFEPGFLGSDFAGITGITGWISIFSLLIMTVLSLPIVRRLHWESFYWSHKLRLVFWIALILHDRHFWKFSVAPLCWYAFERLHRFFNIMRWSRQAWITRIDRVTEEVKQCLLVAMNR